MDSALFRPNFPKFNCVQLERRSVSEPYRGIVHGCLGSSWRRPKKQTDIGFLWIHPSSSPSLRPPPCYSTSSLSRSLSPFLPSDLTSFPRRSSFLVSSGFHLFLNISRSRHRFGHQSLFLSWCLTLCLLNFRRLKLYVCHMVSREFFFKRFHRVDKKEL